MNKSELIKQEISEIVDRLSNIANLLIEVKEPPKEVKPKEDKLVTTKEIAKILNVPLSWIYGKTRLNAIPHIKVGKYIRFNPEEVIESFRKA